MRRVVLREGLNEPFIISNEPFTISLSPETISLQSIIRKQQHLLSRFTLLTERQIQLLTLLKRIQFIKLI